MQSHAQTTSKYSRVKALVFQLQLPCPESLNPTGLLFLGTSCKGLVRLAEIQRRHPITAFDICGCAMLHKELSNPFSITNSSIVQRCLPFVVLQRARSDET